MKKLALVIAIAGGLLFSSCSLFVHTPVGSAGGSVGSTQHVYPANGQLTSAIKTIHSRN